MEIKVKDQKMILEMMAKYLDAIRKGEVPYPRCVICRDVHGEILGIYERPDESNTTIYSICLKCWEEHCGPDAREKLITTGQIDDVLKAKVEAIIDEMLKKDSLKETEIFKMIPEEWTN